MITPERRVHIFPVGATDVEILMLGEPESIASFVAELRTHVESWIGLSSLRPIAMGSQLIGWRVTRDADATHHDPLAEVLLMLRKFPHLAWADGGPRCGLVATW